MPHIFVVAAAVAGTASLAIAQTSENDAKSYPNRAIRMIVPFPAGGPADIIARFVGQRMSEDWGQPVVIENRAGGNTTIGAQAAARSAADGYTLFVHMDTTMVMNPLITPNLPYDPFKDFSPITLLTKNMSLVVVRSDGPRTIKDLIGRAKAAPGKLNMGAGTITSRLGAMLFAKSAGLDVQLVPFKGSPESARPCWREPSTLPSTAPAPACRWSRPAVIARSRNTAIGRCRCCPICRA